ncbi:hypothetical protein BH18CHL2_BH18CHL2_12570 [soil metagenome]
MVRTFGALLERYEREIFAHALRLSASREDADDLFQETFLAAFRAWQPPSAGNERAWLYRIATNKAIDRARRSRRHVPLDGLEVAAPARDGAASIDLAHAIERLPARQRDAFVLRRMRGLSYAEVASALWCSPEAARARVSEATKTVRRRIA